MSPIVVYAKPKENYVELTMKSIIEEHLKDSTNCIQHEQQENVYYMIDDVINDSSLQTYEEHPQETEDGDIELVEDS